MVDLAPVVKLGKEKVIYTGHHKNVIKTLCPYDTIFILYLQSILNS